MRCDTSPSHANDGDFNQAANEQIDATTKSYWYHGVYMTIQDHVWSVYISCVELSKNLFRSMFVNTNME